MGYHLNIGTRPKVPSSHRSSFVDKSKGQFRNSSASRGSPLQVGKRQKGAANNQVGQTVVFQARPALDSKIIGACCDKLQKRTFELILTSFISMGGYHQKELLSGKALLFVVAPHGLQDPQDQVH